MFSLSRQPIALALSAIALSATTAAVVAWGQPDSKGSALAVLAGGLLLPVASLLAGARQEGL